MGHRIFPLVMQRLVWRCAKGWQFLASLCRNVKAYDFQFPSLAFVILSDRINTLPDFAEFQTPQSLEQAFPDLKLVQFVRDHARRLTVFVRIIQHSNKS